MGSLFRPKTVQMPAPEPPAPLPTMDDAAVRAAKAKELAAVRARHSSSSRILAGANNRQSQPRTYTLGRARLASAS